MTTTTTKDYYLRLVAQKNGACHFKNKEVMIIFMILQIRHKGKEGTNCNSMVLDTYYVILIDGQILLYIHTFYYIIIHLVTVSLD